MADIEGLQDDGGMRMMAVPEFVRRVRRGITHDEKNFTWVVGAGCSVSSGVPTAAECSRSWMKELRYLETGLDQDVEAWAAEKFAGFDPSRPAAVYGDVLRRLFHTEADLRRALERMLSAAEPGFGYATLAQIMTHAKWGSRAGLALSVNFDDLLADALHVYSQKRPHTLSQESLTSGTPLSPGTPTVLKLHGDAHLPLIDEATNRPRFRETVRDRLREILTEVGVVFMGYGGREECLLDVLEGLPKGAPAGGVFWVNEEKPHGAFGDWLNRAGAVWVPHSDFDELMYFMRIEFGLGHPKIDRFERVFRKYNAQYRELSTRSGLKLTGTPGADGVVVEPQAIRTPRGLGSGEHDQGGFSPVDDDEDSAIGLDALGEQATRRQTDQSRRERLRQSLSAYSNALRRTAREAPERPNGFRRQPMDVNDLLNEAVIELHGSERPPSAPPSALIAAGHARRPSREDVEKLLGKAEGAFSDFREARQGDQGESEEEVPLDEEGREQQVDAFLRSGASSSQSLEQAASGTEPRRLGEAIAGLAAESGLAAAAGEGAPTLRSSAARAAASTGLRSAAAPSGAPMSPEARANELARVGRMLSVGRRFEDSGTAALDDTAIVQGLPPEPSRRLPVSRASYGEASFAAALEAAPRDATIRVRFARFLAVGLGQLERAEAEYENAQQLAPGDPAVLRDYARFALDYLRDAARAEKLLGQALHQELRNADTLRALGDFLARAHGDLDEAENCLRLAIEIEPNKPRNYVEYAKFLWRRRGRLEEAEAQLRRASELKPESASALAVLAYFLAVGARRLDPAQQTLARAARIAPGDAEVAFARAALAELKGDLDDAEAHYRKAIDGAPGDIDAQLAFASFLQKRRGDLDEAERALRAAIETAPYRAAPSTAYGRFLASARKDRAKAEAALRDAVAAEPYDAEALAALAEHLAPDAAHAAEVEDLYRDALALAPRSSAILVSYGRFLGEHKGDADAAEAQFRAAVEIDPQNAEINDAMAEFLHSVREDAEEAEIFFREALRLAPDRAQTLNRFASFLRATKRDVDEAEHFYRRALEANPRDAHSLAHSAQFLLAKGRRAEGLKVLTDAFDAAWRMDPAVRPPSLMLELWIYRYAHDPARREESFKAAAALIEAGVRCEGWDLGPTVKAAISAGHPDPDILHDLAAVAADGQDASRLFRR